MKTLYNTIIVLIILLVVPIAWSEEAFYLRGADVQETVDSVSYYGLSFTSPDSDSTKTTIIKTTEQGVHEFAAWIGGASPIDYSISETAYMYFSSIGVSDDNVTYRFSIYDYDSSNQNETLLIQSDWFNLPSTPSPHEIYATESVKTIQTGHRGKIVVEYNAVNGGGSITAIIDEGSSGNTSQYTSSNGNTYTANNVSNYALLILNTTGSCNVECSSDTGCDDSDLETTDSCINAGGCNSLCSNVSDPGAVSCNSNSDCDDSNNLTTDTCSNPGTENASCSNTECSIECVSDGDCTAQENGSCDNAGTCSSSCSYAATDPNMTTEDCEVLCTKDSQCNDDIDTTTDTCSNAGTCDASCSNIQCSIACSGNDNCDDGNPLTTSYCSNAEKCDAACIYNSCNPLCSNNSGCDDENDATTDVCAGAGRCSATCEFLNSCGDGTCDSDETMCSCPSDCGTCSGDITDVYEKACIGNTCKTTIKLGVCGNDRCESGENYFNCENDCKPQNINIDVSLSDSFYVRGERIHLKATVTVDGEKIRDVKVRASGFFGGLPLFNEGKHDDGTRNDNIYANYFTIETDTEKMLYPITFTAEIAGITQKKVVFMNVVPKLSFTIEFDKESYILGDDLKLTGTLTNKETPIELPLELNFVLDEIVLLEKDLNSESGNFKANYRTTLLDKDGEYVITAVARDENGNIGFIEKIITVLNPEATNFLNVELGPEDGNVTYKKGSNATIIAIVKSVQGDNISGAIVKGTASTGITFKFGEKEPGLYEGVFGIPYQTPTGKIEIKIDATKQNKHGSVKTEITVIEPQISLEIIEPKADSFLIGEEIKVRVKANYDNEEPVVSEKIFAVVNNETIELHGVEQGIYEGVYIVKTDDEGGIIIKINLDDGYDNTAQETIELEVSGTSYLQYLRLYGTSIVLFLIAAIITLVFGVSFIKKVTGVRSLKKKEERLLEIIKGIQTQYFVEGTMDKKIYDEYMEKYELQLEDIRTSIKQTDLKGKK